MTKCLEDGFLACPAAEECSGSRLTFGKAVQGGELIRGEAGAGDVVEVGYGSDRFHINPDPTIAGNRDDHRFPRVSNAERGSTSDKWFPGGSVHIDVEACGWLAGDLCEGVAEQSATDQMTQRVFRVDIPARPLAF